MADKIRVNGNVVSWGSITVKVDGERFVGFTSVSYSDKRERVKQYGMGKHQAPRGRSRGKYTVEPVKLGGPKSSFQALRAKLAQRAPDGISYGDVECQIVVQYIEADDQESMTVELEDAVWMSNSSSEEESGDPMKEECEFDIMKIRRNGLVLFDASEGAP
jgi:hypothetical protein